MHFKIFIKVDKWKIGFELMIYNFRHQNRESKIVNN